MKHLSRKVAALIATLFVSSFLFALQIEVGGNRSRIETLKESSYENSLAYLLSDLTRMQQDLEKETKERTELADAIAVLSASAVSTTPPTNDEAIAATAAVTFHEPRGWAITEQVSSGGDSSGEVSRAWSPSALTVRVGDTVSWTWSTNENVIDATEQFGESTELLFSSGDLRTGGTFSRKFENPGVFRFISQNSMGLHGTITVLAETSISTAANRDGLQINGGIRVLPAGAGSLPMCDDATVGSIKFTALSYSTAVGTTEEPFFSGLVVCDPVTSGSPGHLFNGWAPMSWNGNAIFHAGEWYTTLDPSYYSDFSASQGQNYWLQLPAGWSVASYSESAMQSVGYNPADTSRHHWGTEYLAFEPTGDTAAVYSTKDGSAVPDIDAAGSRTYYYGVCGTYSASFSDGQSSFQYKCACSQSATRNECPSTFKAKVLIKTNQFSLVHKHLG